LFVGWLFGWLVAQFGRLSLS